MSKIAGEIRVKKNKLFAHGDDILVARETCRVTSDRISGYCSEILTFTDEADLQVRLSICAALSVCSDHLRGPFDEEIVAMDQPAGKGGL